MQRKGLTEQQTDPQKKQALTACPGQASFEDSMVCKGGKNSAISVHVCGRLMGQ
jgi:hypothetical protein